MKNVYRWSQWSVFVIAPLMLSPYPCTADCTATLDPGILAVDASSEATSPDGFSWECAYSELQDAIDVASNPSNEISHIWVAEGTYMPTAGSGRGRTFLLPNDVIILGGFPAGGGDGTEDARDPYTYITTLSGDFNRDDDESEFDDNAFHVVSVVNIDSALTRLDGFVITGGYADGEELDFNNIGGGMQIVRSTGGTTRIFVVQCIFENNFGGLGGAVGARREATNPTGKLVTAQFINCAFRDNQSGVHGGAIYNFGSTVIASNCLFAENSAQSRGGAVFLADTCRGGLCQDQSRSVVELYNCTIANNQADQFGGGVDIGVEADLYTISSIYWGNTAAGGTTEEKQIRALAEAAEYSISYSCIQELDELTTTNSFDDDPLFVNDTAGDYRLDAGSPAINAGPS